MISAPKRKSLVFATARGLPGRRAVALNVSWIVINWREGLLLVTGVILFPVIIAGVVLNTIFLVREVRRSEQHDAFINAVTHELKTPVASIRLYLETLQRRETAGREAARVLPRDDRTTRDRLLQLSSRCCAPARPARGRGSCTRCRVDLRQTVRECLELARVRHHLPTEALAYVRAPRGPPIEATVLGDPDELKAAVSNLVDNAIKYSNGDVRVRSSSRGVDDASRGRPRARQGHRHLRLPS